MSRNSFPDLPVDREGALVRAFQAMRLRARYGLGRGGTDPRGRACDELGRLDCSGLVCHCLGFDRLQYEGDAFDPDEIWYSCNGMVADALDPKRRRRFRVVDVLMEDLREADVIVYRNNPIRGRLYAHTGLITKLRGPVDVSSKEWWRTGIVVTHCHSGANAGVEATNAEPWRTKWKAVRGTMFLRYLRFSGDS